MADDSRLSSVVDEEGRLFGVVNVIDALVGLLVVAVAVAGIALLAPGLGSDTRYATIDLGPQPDHTAAQITVGDEWDVDGGFTITDVYMYPAEDDAGGDTNVMIRAAVNGAEIDSGAGQENPIEFNGEPLRYDRVLEIETNQYAVEGTVIDVSGEGDTLDTTTEDLVLETTVDPATAGQVQPGDTYTVGETELLSVQSVTVYPTGEPDERRLVIGVSAATRMDGETPLFGDHPVETGTTLPVRTGTYSLTGEVTNTGSLEEPGVPATQQATVEIDSIDQTRASQLAVGMTEDVGTDQTAEVVAIDNQPREEIVQSGSGYDIIEHPRDRQVTLTVDLVVQERDDGTIAFRGEPLRIGDDVQLELDGIIVEGELAGLS